MIDIMVFTSQEEQPMCERGYAKMLPSLLKTGFSERIFGACLLDIGPNRFSLADFFR